MDHVEEKEFTLRLQVQCAFPRRLRRGRRRLRVVGGVPCGRRRDRGRGAACGHCPGLDRPPRQPRPPHRRRDQHARRRVGLSSLRLRLRALLPRGLHVGAERRDDLLAEALLEASGDLAHALLRDAEARATSLPSGVGSSAERCSRHTAILRSSRAGLFERRHEAAHGRREVGALGLGLGRATAAQDALGQRDALQPFSPPPPCGDIDRARPRARRARGSRRRDPPRRRRAWRPAAWAWGSKPVASSFCRSFSRRKNRLAPWARVLPTWMSREFVMRKLRRT